MRMEIGVRILGVILVVLDWILRPIYYLRYGGERQKVPAFTDPLLFHSAVSLARKIRNGELTSEHTLKAYISRIKEVEPHINAVVEDRFPQALAEARRVDELVARCRSEGCVRQLEGKPLLGVPFTVKESCSLSGLSSSVGSLELEGRRAASDGASVARVRAAGAIPLLVSNTPELCLSWETINLLKGTTNNPHDLCRTAGGSSGGEGALLASGGSVIGVGSDIAGSIRVPAHYNGVFGHKPTPGVIPIDGHIPTLSDENFSRFLVVGPMCRYAEDLQMLTAVMAGDQAETLRLHEPVKLNTLKVCYATTPGWSIAMLSVDEEIQEKIRNAARYLHQECGMEMIENTFTELQDSVELSVGVFFGLKDIPNMLQDPANPKRQKNLIVEILKSLFGASLRSLHALGFSVIQTTNLFIPKYKYQFYCNEVANLREKFTRVLGSDGVFLYPVFQQSATFHNQIFTKASGIMYTMIFNVLGMPSTCVPMGLDSNGLPVGIQVVAAPHEDRLCLAVAKQLELGFGGWTPPAPAVTPHN